MEFVKTNNGYEAEFTSEGQIMVQLNRVAPGGVEIQASLDGTSYAVVDGESMDATCVFAVNMPEGAYVRITSTTEVIVAETLNF